jgi:5-methylcytosine-specific restriction endonuclease McrA
MPATKVCKTCGKDFVAYRSTATFCSDSCRYHMHLRKKKRITVPNDMRFSILRRDGFRCRLCGDAGTSEKVLQVDHIRSLDDGGAMMDMSNLLTLCRACNLGKGKRSLDPSEVPPLTRAAECARCGERCDYCAHLTDADLTHADA